MRLLDVNTLRLSNFSGTPPPYTILSHTWEEEEVTFEDIQNLDTASELKGFGKIQGCCRQAIEDRFSWVWIDTCCIDKTSSSELSEAINSMYKWYHESGICYAYLSDVPELSAEDLHSVQKDIRRRLEELCYVSRSPAARYDKGPIVRSKWFRRGWTLQELIAPRVVEFYSQGWTGLGTKSSLEILISLRTKIPVEVLRGASPHTYCVSQRLTWASDRATTRKEDVAYCLLGLCGINMPLLYGEGKQAFIRLQEEILRQTEDMSILVWAINYNGNPAGVFATDPSSFDLDDKVAFHDHPPNKGHGFSGLHHTRSLQTNLVHDPPLITSRGIMATMLLEKRSEGTFLAWLHTAGYTHQHPVYGEALETARPLLAAPTEFALCVELGEKQMPPALVSHQLRNNNKSQPKVLERTDPATIHGIDAAKLKRFKPQKVFLLYKRRHNNDRGLNWRSHLDRHTHVRVLDQGCRHLVNMVPTPETSMKCIRDEDCIKLEFPIGSIASCPVTTQQHEPWNSARILGVTRIEIGCLAGRPHQDSQEEGNKLVPDIVSCFAVGWAFSDQVQHLQCILRQAGEPEASLHNASRVEFTDRKYGRLFCGHMLTIRIINRQSGGTIYTSIELRLT